MARRNRSSINTKVEDLAPQRQLPEVAKAPSVSVDQPARKLSPIKLRVFLASSGLKPDQSAGFESFARNNKLGPMSIPQWHTELDKFFSRPVK